MRQEKKFNIAVSKSIITSYLTQSQAIQLITNTVRNKLYNKNGTYESAQVDYEVAKVLRLLDIKTEDFSHDIFFPDNPFNELKQELEDCRESLNDEIDNLNKYRNNFREFYDTDVDTFPSDREHLEQQKVIVNELRISRLKKSLWKKIDVFSKTAIAFIVVGFICSSFVIGAIEILNKIIS